MHYGTLYYNRPLALTVTAFVTLLYVFVSSLAVSVMPQIADAFLYFVGSLIMLLVFGGAYLIINSFCQEQFRITACKKYGIITPMMTAYFLSLAVNFFITLMGVQIPSQEVFTNSVSHNLLLCLHAVIITPIVEELVFRKLMTRLLSPFGYLARMLICTFVFASLHGVEGFLHAFCFGILLYYLYSAYGLYYSVMIHFLANLVSCSMLLIFEYCSPNVAFLCDLATLGLVIFVGSACTIILIIRIVNDRKNSKEYNPNE